LVITPADHEAFVRQLLVETREELLRADAKASLLLASTGVAIGALIAGLLARTWSPYSLDNRVEWLWWVGVAAAAAAVWKLGAAVAPRTKRQGSPPTALAYFADVNAYTDRSALMVALRDSTGESFERNVDQLQQVSRIVGAKYTLIRRSLWLLVAATASCSVSVLASGML
jgi:hypothetical protein